MTEKIQWEAIKWPENMAPSRSPIHFTNELVVAAAPETIWSLLVDPGAWPSFYPGVEHIQLLDGHESLRLGTRFETNLAGQDVVASVEEFEPIANAYGVSPEELGNLPSSVVISQAFPGAKLVKAFNHLTAEILAEDPSDKGLRRVVFLSGEDEDAVAEVEALVEQLGYAPGDIRNV